MSPWLTTPFLALSVALSGSLQANDPVVVSLWPGAIPGEQEAPGEEKIEAPKPDEASPTTRVTYVGRPSIEIRRPPAGKANGAAVIIAPGGGYNLLAIDKEGTEVADWLNSIGVTGIVLKYRVPRRAGDTPGEPPPGPLQDAQRALSIVRARASEWGIDPSRIGLLGFSAGGHLTARAGTLFASRSYSPIDDADRVSCRPDFCVLIYPAYLVGPEGRLREDLPISSQTPPMFLAHAHDDRVSPENSAILYLELKRAGVSAELHIYESGGHGFGLRPSNKPCATWTARCEQWLRARGIVPEIPSSK